jgi:HK97 family phage major capsid protein
MVMDPEELKALAQQLKSAADDVKKQGEHAAAEMKRIGELSVGSKAAADEALTKHNELAARLNALEQKAVRSQGEGRRHLSAGAAFTAAEEFKSFVKGGGRGRIAVEVKAIVSSLTTDADGSAGDLVVPNRLPGINMPGLRTMRIRDLLMPGRTATGLIQYQKETGFTNAAATVSETSGATKATSDIKFDLISSAVTTIAHLIKTTKQILDDVPALQSYIDGRLRYGLMLREEAQLLSGAGTGTELNGVDTQATAYAAPITPDGAGNLNRVDVLRLAMLQAALAEYPSSGIVLHPGEWAQIELTKDESGGYLFSNPAADGQPRLWGLPVVATQALAADRFLVGAFNMGAQIFDRQDATVEISTEDGDNFAKNLITIRAEERLALAVFRPEAFIKGTFSTALAL